MERVESPQHPFDTVWELRLGPMRVFYDVDDAAQVVRVERIGYKRGNDLYVRDERVELRNKP